MFERIQLALLKRKIESIQKSQSMGDGFFSKEEYIRGFTLEQNKEDSFVNGVDKFSYLMDEDEALDLKYSGTIPKKMFNLNIKSDEYLKIESWKFWTDGVFEGVDLHATNRLVFHSAGTVEKLPGFMLDYIELIEDFRAEQYYNSSVLKNYEEYLKDDENNSMPFNFWNSLFIEHKG